MRHGSLFSGIGGFDLAAEWMGWTNVFHCENNEFCQKVLKHHFPNSIVHDDITKTDFNEYKGRIDIVTGGFPCQPYSQAGKRKGKADDRHLWPQMLRAIIEIQPAWVVGENVPGLLNWERGMVLAEIYADLELRGLKYSHLLYCQLVVKTHRTAGTGFGLLLGTPRAMERPRSEKFLQKDMGIKRAPTPSELIQDKKLMKMLLPTPQASDAKGGSNQKRNGAWESNLDDFILITTGSKASQLNHRFIAEMMGYPTNWLDFQNIEGNQSTPSETQ